MVTVVTGAAGGIGRAVVRALAGPDDPVAAFDIAGPGLEETLDDPCCPSGTVHPMPVDVCDPHRVECAVRQVERSVGPVTGLVNAAGVLHDGEVRDFDGTSWDATFAVNVKGVFHTSRAVVDRMIPRGDGALVTVASNASSTPRMGMAAYGASKAAAAMFTRTLGLEVARHGIRANVVAPGSTDTPMLHALWHDDTARESTLQGSTSAFRLGIPLGRVADPADVADAVAFLLSDRARHITMNVLTVDGGASLGS